jgi:hypothetical protein
VEAGLLRHPGVTNMAKLAAHDHANGLGDGGFAPKAARWNGRRKTRKELRRTAPTDAESCTTKEVRPALGLLRLARGGASSGLRSSTNQLARQPISVGRRRATHSVMNPTYGCG